MTIFHFRIIGACRLLYTIYCIVLESRSVVASFYLYYLGTSMGIRHTAFGIPSTLYEYLVPSMAREPTTQATTVLLRDNVIKEHNRKQTDRLG